jgi:hypothetical protein
MGALLASALHAAAARADTVLHAPEACGSTQDLEQRITALAGPARAALTADVTVTAEASDYRLTVSLPGETRELRDSDCHALLEAAAVVLALELRASAPEATQAPEITPHVESIPTRIDAAPAPARAQRPVGSNGWLELGGHYGMLPGPTAALGVGAALEVGRAGLALQAHYLWPSETAGEPAVRVQGVQAALLLRVVPVARLALGLGGAAAFLHGRGTRVDHVHRAWVAPASALVEARLTVLELQRNQLGITGGAGLALVRPRFRVAGHGSVHQPAPWQASLGLFWSADFF